MSEVAMIKFKLTGGSQEIVELAYEEKRTVGEYLEDLGELFDSPAENFKMVFKGKILTWKVTAEQAKLKGGTVMVVLNTVGKQPKKVIASKDQIVKGAGMSTGLGPSSPFGVGGYEVVNHPQYMSAISNAVDPDKVEEMMDDPQYQGMMQQMLDDPDTMRQLMEENPMMKNMMKDNPALKALMSNPAFMKSILNKDMMKKTAEFMKKGGDVEDPQAMAKHMGMGGMGAMGGMQGMGGMGGVMQGMQGQGLGSQPTGNFGGFGNFGNPNMANQQLPFANGNGNQQQGGQVDQQALQNMFQTSFFERMYAAQLKQLQEYGFKDRVLNLQILREVNGNIDQAMEKLCPQ